MSEPTPPDRDRDPEPDPPARLPGTPCPFLRAAINPDNAAKTGVTPMTQGRASLRELYAHGKAHSGSRLFGVVLMGVGAMSNGLGREGIWRNALTLSFDSAALTGGPLDKPRADTRILQGRGDGVFCRDHFDRIFESFGRTFTPTTGGSPERGIDLKGIAAMIRAHRERDDGNALTTLAAYGEFVPALWIFGTASVEGPRYLSERGLLAMFRDMRFPPSAASR